MTKRGICSEYGEIIGITHISDGEREVNIWDNVRALEKALDEKEAALELIGDMIAYFQNGLAYYDIDRNPEKLEEFLSMTHRYARHPEKASALLKEKE